MRALHPHDDIDLLVAWNTLRDEIPDLRGKIIILLTLIRKINTTIRPMQSIDLNIIILLLKFMHHAQLP